MRSNSKSVSEKIFFNPMECLLLSHKTFSWRQSLFSYPRWRKPLAHTLTHTQTHIQCSLLYSCCSWHTVSTVFALRVKGSHSTRDTTSASLPAQNKRLVSISTSLSLITSVSRVFIQPLTFLHPGTANFNIFDQRMWSWMKSCWAPLYSAVWKLHIHKPGLMSAYVVNAKW